MALLGYRADYVEALINRDAKFLSVPDVQYLIDAGQWSQAQGVQHLMDQGFTSDMANTHLSLEVEHRKDPFRMQLATDGGDHYAARDIERDQFNSILDATGLPDDVKQMLVLVYGQRRELLTKRLTLAQAKAAVDQGIWTIDDYRAYLLKEGYSLDDAQIVELVELAK